MNFKEFIQVVSIYVVSLIVRYIYFPVMRCYWKCFDDDSDSEYGPFVEYESDDFIVPPKTVSNGSQKMIPNDVSKESSKETPKELSDESRDESLWVIEKDDSFECLKRALNNGSPTSSKD